MTIRDGYFECDLCGKSTSGEYNTDTGNHTACEEIATLRAQLEEAKDVISQMYFAITPNKHATLALLEAQRRAYQYLDSVKSGD